MQVRVGTFNLNNLFDRWNFDGALDALAEGQRAVTARFVFDDPGRRRLQLDATGRLLVEKKPEDRIRVAERLLVADVDVWGVQEVENVDVLRQFARDHLDSRYPHVALVEGNDAARFIDVAVLSRFPLGAITSHHQAVHPDDPDERVFSRDLLEAEILTRTRRDRLFTLFVTHLKSKFVPFNDPDPDGARERANERRRRQAETITRIIEARTTPRTRYVLVGDMNDTTDAAPLAAFARENLLVDALADPTEIGQLVTTAEPPPGPRWTATHKESGRPRRYDLIDQIWLSPALAPRQTDAVIGRRSKLNGDGSDHDPAWITLNL